MAECLPRADVIRATVFGRLAMTLQMSFEITLMHRFRPELFIRASVRARACVHACTIVSFTSLQILRMLDTSGDYYINPTAQVPVLAYLGISLVQVYIKVRALHAALHAHAAHASRVRLI
jgi:hypothetical protein